jgi:diguanylate cyclase (GGDEF)-like protein
MADPRPHQLDLTLHALNHATRSLASEMDETRLVDRALDTLADFGCSERVALLMIQEQDRYLEVAGVLSRGKRARVARLITFLGTPLEQVMATRLPGCFPMEPDDDLPLPSSVEHPKGLQCLCLPLIGSHHLVIGVVTLERAGGEAPSDPQIQLLNVLATLLAVSLENARLFHLATVDGLTGLYTRRYFEIRLQEEVARIGRHGGIVSLLLTDIDDFKQVNDRYGHQQGDLVLRDLAALLRATIRKGIDLPCRYGGEEFATILPVTDLDGACEMAERLLRSCQEYRFPGQPDSLAITLSGGVATMEQDHLVSGEELVRRADAVLYEAKQSGRNRICAWRER